MTLSQQTHSSWFKTWRKPHDIVTVTKAHKAVHVVFKMETLKASTENVCIMIVGTSRMLRAMVLILKFSRHQKAGTGGGASVWTTARTCNRRISQFLARSLQERLEWL